MRAGPSILVAAALLLAPADRAGAQDSDQIYAIVHRDAEARAARRGEVPQASSRGWGFFGNLFGRRREIPEITVRPPDTAQPGTAPGQAAGQPAARTGRQEQGTGEMPGGPRAYCVRLCDGFYFPAGPALSGAGRRAQQMNCSNFCPGAEVALYTVARSGTIEQAVGPRGQAYAALSTAFRFRERINPSCTCSGLATNGLARLPITHDFTLRAGDLVVTEAGVRIFAGGARFPYRARDFVEARNYGRLPADVRRRVAEIQAGIQARDTGTAAPVARLAPQPARRAGMGRAAAAPPAAAPAAAAAVAGVRVLDLPRREETTLR